MTDPKQPVQPVGDAKLSRPAPEEPKTRAEVKAEIDRLAQRLDKMDAQKHSGASHRLPKGRMLDASAIEKKDPNNHYLYVNSDDPGNLQTHLESGYSSVGEDECKTAGVRQRVGELVLMRIPRKEFEERVEEAKETARSRLGAHRAEFRGEMESIVRELRDRGYKDHDIRRMMVDE